jgi:plastocyanin
MPARALASLTLATILTVACGGGAPPPLPPRQPTPLDLATTGSIHGEIRFQGTPPPMKEIRFGSFAECTAHHQGPVAAGDMLVKDGLVENAFVYIQHGLGERVFAIPSTPVVIDQKGCLYRPRVAGTQVGQLITYLNSDTALHNVHGTPKASPSWNFALARAGLTRQIRLDKPEIMVSVRCDLHPWMQGWIGVVDHPYFAVSSADGTFRLAQVPPGTYTLAVWHERFGTQTQQVTLTDRADVEASFAFTAP